MAKLSVICFFAVIFVLIPNTTGNFDFNIFFCRFKWGDKKNVKTQETPTIPGYYWRDYHGMIPEDAFPVDSEDSTAKTYVGFVLDGKLNATYGTTIVNGMDYVYTVQDGEVHQLTDNIQILCTQQPEKLKWTIVKTDKDEVLSNAKPIEAGWQYFQIAPDERWRIKKSVVRVITEDIKYAGSIRWFNDSLEYATIDGIPRMAQNFETLLYNESDSTAKVQKKKKGKFFDFEFKYAKNPSSIIPWFYEKFKLGPFQMTCTNSDEDEEDLSKQTDITSDYFWIPKVFFSDNKYALETGISYYEKKTSYTGQALHSTGIDIGASTDGEDVEIPGTYSISLVDTGLNIFGTTTPEMFEWISTNSTQMKNLDASKLIQGGMLFNGTKVFVGRVKMTDWMETASVRVFGTEAYAYGAYIYPTSEFEVLSHV